MNLTGIMPNYTYAVDVLRQGTRQYTGTGTGHEMAQFLKELRGILRRKGYSDTQGNVRKGFKCYNGTETIKIVVERL